MMQGKKNLPFFVVDALYNVNYFHQFLDAVFSDAQEEGRDSQCQTGNGSQAPCSSHAACAHSYLEGILFLRYSLFSLNKFSPEL